MNLGNRKALFDLAIIAVILVLAFLLFAQVDALETLAEWSRDYEDYEVDEIASTLIVLSFCMAWFSVRRWREERRNHQKLQETLRAMRRLEGIIPICMHCKGIRDDQGAWNQLEKYICEHSEARFNHSICEKCLKEHYPEDSL